MPRPRKPRPQWHSVSLRTCVECGAVKTYSEFYLMGDGDSVRPDCAECHKAKAVLRRQRDILSARQYGREYYAKNADSLRELARPKSPKDRIDNAISGGVMRGIRQGSKNGRRSFDLLGYSLEDLMSHLEGQFEPWMNWGNYGFYGWHIDHIRPLSSFTYVTPDDPQFREAWALINLRPLAANDNWQKGAKWDAANDNLSPDMRKHSNSA